MGIPRKGGGFIQSKIVGRTLQRGVAKVELRLKGQTTA